MKTWLKGGLIGGGILVVLITLSWILSKVIPTGEPLSYLEIFILYPCIFFFSGESGMACIVYGPIINLIMISLIGSLIGFLIQKYKTKNYKNKK